MNNKFKLGIDLHGVIDDMPDFFAFLTDSFIKNGGEVHIITGGSWTNKMESEIKSYGIKYTHYFSVYDFLINNDSVVMGRIRFPDGTIQNKFKDEDWDSVKANYCRENNITLHLDDTMVYNEFFTTPFGKIWSHSGQIKTSHINLI